MVSVDIHHSFLSYQILDYDAVVESSKAASNNLSKMANLRKISCAVERVGS